MVRRSGLRRMDGFIAALQKVRLFHSISGHLANGCAAAGDISSSDIPLRSGKHGI